MNIVKNYKKAKKDALYSQERLKKYTWEIVAKKYIDVFEKAVQGNIDYD
jgi:glycosyltransferase involved in cell wall biosynthesis